MLTRKQKMFVQEYIIDFNAARAAREAGYSPKTARFIGVENLSKPHIQEAISIALQDRMERLRLSQDDVLHELALLGQSNLDHYALDENGNLTLAEGAPEDAMRAVSSVKRRVSYAEDGTPTYHVEFRLWDKVASLTLVGRHIGMWRDKLEHSGEIKSDLSVQATESLRSLARALRSRRAGSADPGN